MPGHDIHPAVAGQPIEVFQHPDEKADRDAGMVDKDALNDAFAAEDAEHDMGVWEAVKAYPMACLWSLVFTMTIIMESFDMFLIGNFVALPAFRRDYGTFVNDVSGYVIATKWQSALSQAGQIGALLGVLLAGPMGTRLGYRWSIMVGLMLLNGTIFISFFARSLPVFLIGQLFEGVSWGIFIALSPAYASEVVPMPLRGAATATLQMAWAIGSIIVGGATYALNQRQDEWAYRIPLALQWIFPTPLLILVFFAPESPWWLIRRGRKSDALKSIRRLGRKTKQNPQDVLSMMERTVEIEASLGRQPNYLDVFKGTDLRRTLIICLIYAGQNLAGNLISNQAVYFFEQAGMTTDFAFAMGLILAGLQAIAVGFSWVLSAYFGRRQLYIWGTAVNVGLLFGIGIAGSVTQNRATNLVQAVFGLLQAVVYALTLGPVSYTVIAETSAVRLRALSTGIGRGAYYIVEIPLIYLSSQMLNPTGWNLAGKCGYIWGGTATICLISAFFGLPELKGRSYREVDILFKRHVPARKFETTIIDVRDNE